MKFTYEHCETQEEVRSAAEKQQEKELKRLITEYTK